MSASNAITASSYLLEAAGVESTTWKLRGLAIAAVGFAVGVHTVTPRVGRWLQDLLGAVKLFILLFIVCTGFAALGGHLKVPNPHNFDVSTSFKGTSNNGYNIGTALLNAIFSFQGYDNMNMVGTFTSHCGVLGLTILSGSVGSEEPAENSSNCITYRYGECNCSLPSGEHCLRTVSYLEHYQTHLTIASLPEFQEKISQNPI